MSHVVGEALFQMLSLCIIVEKVTAVAVVVAESYMKCSNHVV